MVLHLPAEVVPAGATERVVIWFVTPAFRRYELTAICLDQRRMVIDELAQQGIEARCVVVADDSNLDTARALGFDTVRQNNDWLGRRFNDGMEYAGKHGATWIVPIGSDSWILPDYFLPLPEGELCRTSGAYAAVASDKMAVLDVGRHGAGPYMFHRSVFTRGFRPARDELHRYIDSSTIAGLGHIAWERRDLHPLQYVGFRGHPHLTPYDRLWRAWGTRESTDPWTELAAVYPADLVERARHCLSSTSAHEPTPQATAIAPSSPSTA